MPKVSIIVPVYKAEAYLHRCVDSLLAQTFTDFEILLIDDGSPDRSGEICDEYAKKDPRIRVFHKENGGVSSARNLGIENMIGEFVSFIDADDELYPNSINALMAEMADDVGSTVGSYQYLVENQPDAFRLKEETKRVSMEEAILDFYKTNQKDWQRYLWNRLFRTKYIDDYHLRFREDIYFKEDGLFLIQFLTMCKLKVGYTGSFVYKYRINSTSATAALRKGFNPKLLTNIYAHSEIVKTIKERVSNQEILLVAKVAMFNSYNWVIGYLRDKKQRQTVINELKPILINSIGLTDYQQLLRKKRVSCVVDAPRLVLCKILMVVKNKFK